MQKKEDFSQWLLSVALRMNQVMNQERDNTMKQVIQEAKEYIMDNYQDPDLSVEKICRHLHMSPAYFSTMFKKETGQAYIAYLTEVRLNKAVELLGKTDDCIQGGVSGTELFQLCIQETFRYFPNQVQGSQTVRRRTCFLKSRGRVCKRPASATSYLFILR